MTGAAALLQAANAVCRLLPVQTIADAVRDSPNCAHAQAHTGTGTGTRALTHTHERARARAPTRTHARTHARARTHTHTHEHTSYPKSLRSRLPLLLEPAHILDGGSRLPAVPGRHSAGPGPGLARARALPVARPPASAWAVHPSESVGSTHTATALGPAHPPRPSPARANNRNREPECNSAMLYKKPLPALGGGHAGFGWGRPRHRCGARSPPGPRRRGSLGSGDPAQGPAQDSLLRVGPPHQPSSLHGIQSSAVPAATAPSDG